MASGLLSEWFDCNGWAGSKEQIVWDESRLSRYLVWNDESVELETIFIAMLKEYGDEEFSAGSGDVAGMWR